MLSVFLCLCSSEKAFAMDSMENNIETGTNPVVDAYNTSLPHSRPQN